MSSATSINLAIEQAHKDGIRYGSMASELGLSNKGFKLKRDGKRPWKWNEVVTLSDFIGVSLDDLRGELRTSVSNE